MKSIKKIFAFVSIVLSISIAIPTYAVEYDFDNYDYSLPINFISNDLKIEIPAKSGVLIESSTSTILYEKNPHDKMPPASITKIMTLILVMEKLNSKDISLTDTVTVSEHANSMGGSQIWLEVGEQMSVDDLIKATAISSANDAAVALAEYIAGSEQNFVLQMNNKASELGMKNTTFMNASGLDADGHISTAYDIALMSRELLKYKDIFNYTTKWMDSLREGKTELVNTNKLIKTYAGATGLKTGTTDGAGSCLSATANRDGMELIAVTMGSETSKDRFNAASYLLDFGFSSYQMYVPEYIENIPPIRISHGVKDSVDIEVSMPKNGIVIKKGSQSKLSQELVIQDNIQSPVNQSQIVGKVIVSLDGKVLYEMDVKTKENVEKINIFSAFLKIINKIFNL